MRIRLQEIEAIKNLEVEAARRKALELIQRYPSCEQVENLLQTTWKIQSLDEMAFSYWPTNPLAQQVFVNVVRLHLLQRVQNQFPSVFGDMTIQVESESTQIH